MCVKPQAVCASFFYLALPWDSQRNVLGLWVCDVFTKWLKLLTHREPRWFSWTRLSSFLWRGSSFIFFSVSEESLWAPPSVLHSSFHTYIQLIFSDFYCCLEFFFALKEKQNKLKEKRKNTHKCHSVLIKLQLLSIQRPFSLGVTWPADLLSPFQLWVLVASPSQLTFFRVFICHRLHSFSFI